MASNNSSNKTTRASRKAAQQEPAPATETAPVVQPAAEPAPVASTPTEQAPATATAPTPPAAPVGQEQAPALSTSAATPSTSAPVASTTAKVRRNGSGSLQQRTDNALAHAADTTLPRRTPQGAGNMAVPHGSNMHRVLCALAAAPNGLCPAGITQATGLVKGRQLVPLQAAGYITRIHAGKGGYLCAITPAGLAAIGQSPAEPAPAADAAQGQAAADAA